MSSGNRGLSEHDVRDYSFQILAGLAYLNSHGLVHRNLSLENVLVDKYVRSMVMLLTELQRLVKLADYGMFHMTGYGSFANFPIGHVVPANYSNIAQRSKLFIA